jgi:hypothetical protein
VSIQTGQIILLGWVFCKSSNLFCFLQWLLDSCFSLLSWSIYSHGFQLENFFKGLERGLKSEIVICFIKEEKTIKRRKNDFLKCWIHLFIKHFINLKN